jgi:hypothetical protein
VTAGADGAWWWGRGYAFTPDGRLLEDGEIGRALATAAEWPETLAPTLNGCFAAAFGTPGTTVLVTDRYGTVPIYVGPGRPGLVASDDPWVVASAGPCAPRLDPVGVVDMLRLGYVAGDRTLLEGISSLALGTVARISAGTLRTHRYWRIRYPEVPRRPARRHHEADDAHWMVRLDDAYSEAGARIDAFCAARDRNIRLMSTGGLDTRVLAGLLATRTRTGVEMMSYGAPPDPDVDAASAIARAMGWPFDAVPVGPEHLDDRHLRDAAREIGVSARFTCGAGARVVPPPGRAVTVCGHTGFLSSDMQRRNLMISTPAQLQRMITLVHYTYPRSDELVRLAAPGVERELWARGLEESLADTDPRTPITEMHRWAAENRHRKLVHLEASVYARQGAWMYPLHDHALVDVFVRLPWRLRVAQRLYGDHAVSRLFTGRGAPLGAIPRVGHGGSFTSDGSVYRRFETMQLFQPAAGEVITRLGPALTKAAYRLRREWELTSGPNPLRHWFRTDARVRAFVLERLGDATNEFLDGDALRKIALDESTGESAFQRLVAGALTVAAVEDEARAVWHDHAAARSA